jgi:hypothetical protein
MGRASVKCGSTLKPIDAGKRYKVAGWAQSRNAIASGGEPSGADGALPEGAKTIAKAANQRAAASGQWNQ